MWVQATPSRTFYTFRTLESTQSLFIWYLKTILFCSYCRLDCYLSPRQWQRPWSLALQGLCSRPRWRCRRSGRRRATGRWRRPPPPSGSGWRRATAGLGPPLGRWDGGNAASRSPEELRGTGGLREKEEGLSGYCHSADLHCWHSNTGYRGLVFSCRAVPTI